MSKRIIYSEFEKANKKCWGLLYNYLLNGDNLVEYRKNKTICDLYKKQNRLNLFCFLEPRYKDYIKYGKKTKFYCKSVLLSPLLLIPIFAYPMMYLIFLFIFGISIISYTYCDYKYEISDDEYNFQKKYNPNFEREQKLKRILEKKYLG